MNQAFNGTLHCLSKSVSRKFVLPVFGIEMFLDRTNKDIAFTSDRGVREVVVDYPQNDIAWQLDQI